MTRYTAPKSKRSPDPAEESADSKRWRHLVLILSFIIGLTLFASLVTTPSNQELDWKCYALVALVAPFDLFFWFKWQQCLVRDDQQKDSILHRVSPFILVGTCAYALARTVSLLI